MDTLHHRAPKELGAQYYPAGIAEVFKLVRNYDGNETVQFAGVLVGEGDLTAPTNNVPLDHWLNVSDWAVEITFTPTSLSPSFPTAPGWTASFTLPTGRTAALADDGTATLNDSDPIAQEECYKGNAWSKITWAWDGTNASAPYGYNLTEMLTIEIHHGLWGFHADRDEWMVNLNVELNETTEEYINEGEDDYTEYGTQDPTTMDPGTQCPPGFEFLEGSENEYLPDEWNWTCHRLAYSVMSTATKGIDPDAGETPVGTFMGGDVVLRYTGTFYGPGLDPMIEITISPSAYYS